MQKRSSILALLILLGHAGAVSAQDDPLSLEDNSRTPVRLVIYPGEGHGNSRMAARLDYSMRLVRWMDHYLMGPGGDAPPYELDHAGRLAEIKEGAD